MSAYQTVRLSIVGYCGNKSCKRLVRKHCRATPHTYPSKEIIAPVEDYDKVIICSPVWAFSVCSPVYEFALRFSGKLKSTEYIFVHFSPAMKYKRTALALDSMLGVTRAGYQSVVCMWGKVLGKKTFK